MKYFNRKEANLYIQSLLPTFDSLDKLVQFVQNSAYDDIKNADVFLKEDLMKLVQAFRLSQGSLYTKEFALVYLNVNEIPNELNAYYSENYKGKMYLGADLLQYKLTHKIGNPLSHQEIIDIINEKLRNFGIDNDLINRLIDKKLAKFKINKSEVEYIIEKRLKDFTNEKVYESVESVIEKLQLLAGDSVNEVRIKLLIENALRNFEVNKDEINDLIREELKKYKINDYDLIQLIREHSTIQNQDIQEFIKMELKSYNTNLIAGLIKSRIEQLGLEAGESITSAQIKAEIREALEKYKVPKDYIKETFNEFDIPAEKITPHINSALRNFELSEVQKNQIIDNIKANLSDEKINQLIEAKNYMTRLQVAELIATEIAKIPEAITLDKINEIVETSKNHLLQKIAEINMTEERVNTLIDNKLRDIDISEKVNQVLDAKDYPTKTFLNNNYSSKSDIENLATKESLNTLATKEEIKDFITNANISELATKAEIENLATKESLNTLATKEEIKDFKTEQQINELINAALLGHQAGMDSEQIRELITAEITKIEKFLTKEEFNQFKQTIKDENAINALIDAKLQGFSGNVDTEELKNSLKSEFILKSTYESDKSGIENRLQQLESGNINVNLDEYYKKSETYSKQEIESQIVKQAEGIVENEYKFKNLKLKKDEKEFKLDISDDDKLKFGEKSLAFSEDLDLKANKSDVPTNEALSEKLDLYLKKSEAIGSDPTQISKLVNDTIDNNLDKINANDQRFFPAMKLVVNGILKQHGLNIPRGKPKGEIRNTILEFELFDSKTNGNKILNNVRIYKDNKLLYLKTFKKENFKVDGEVECIFSTEKPAWSSYVNSFPDTPADYQLQENEVKGIVSWTESSDIWYSGLSVFSQNPGESYQYYSGKGNKAKLTFKLENFYPDSVVYDTFDNTKNHGTLKLNFKALVNDNFELISLDKIFDNKIDTTFKFPTKHQEEYDRIDFAGYDLSNLDSSIDEKVEQKFIDARFVEKTNLKQRVSEEMDVIASEEPYNTKLKTAIIEKLNQYLEGKGSGSAFAKVSEIVDSAIGEVIGKKASANTVIPQARYIINKTFKDLGFFKSFDKPNFEVEESKFKFLLQDASGSSYGVGLMNIAFYKEDNKRLYVNKIKKTKWTQNDGMAEFILSEERPSIADCTTLPEFTDSYELQPGEVKGKVEWDVSYSADTYSGLHAMSYAQGHPYYYMNTGKGDANLTYTLYNFFPNKITYANGDSDRYSKKITIYSTVNGKKNGLIEEIFELNKGRVFKEILCESNDNNVADLIIKDLNLDNIDESLEAKVNAKFAQSEYVEKALLNQKIDTYLDSRELFGQENIGKELKKILALPENEQVVGATIPTVKAVTSALLKDNGVYIPLGKPKNIKNMIYEFQLRGYEDHSYGPTFHRLQFTDAEGNILFLKYLTETIPDRKAEFILDKVGANKKVEEVPVIPSNYEAKEGEYKGFIEWDNQYSGSYKGYYVLGDHDYGYLAASKKPVDIKVSFENLYPKTFKFSNTGNGWIKRILVLVRDSEGNIVLKKDNFYDKTGQFTDIVMPQTREASGIEIVKQSIDQELDEKINTKIEGKKYIRKELVEEMIENKFTGYGFGDTTDEGRLRILLSKVLKPYGIEVPLVKPEGNITKLKLKFDLFESYNGEYGPCLAVVQLYDNEGNKLYVSKIGKEGQGLATTNGEEDIIFSKTKSDVLNNNSTVTYLPRIPSNYILQEGEFKGKIKWNKSYDGSYYYGYQILHPEEVSTSHGSYIMGPNQNTPVLVELEIEGVKPKKVTFKNGIETRRTSTKMRLLTYVDLGDTKDILLGNELFAFNDTKPHKIEVNFDNILN